MQAPKELTLSVPKTLVEVFRQAAAQHAGRRCEHRGGFIGNRLCSRPLLGDDRMLGSREAHLSISAYNYESILRDCNGVNFANGDVKFDAKGQLAELRKR